MGISLWGFYTFYALYGDHISHVLFQSSFQTPTNLLSLNFMPSFSPFVLVSAASLCMGLGPFTESLATDKGHIPEENWLSHSQSLMTGMTMGRSLQLLGINESNLTVMSRGQDFPALLPILHNLPSADVFFHGIP